MVPALGKDMRVEDSTSSMERAALLSSPCSYLAWLGFFELFQQPHWDNNIQFAGAEELCMVPSTRAQQKSGQGPVTVPPAQGGLAGMGAWHKASHKARQRAVCGC